MTDTRSAPTARRTIDFDHHGPEFRDRCPAMIQELHSSGSPLGFSPHHGGFWAIYGYEAIFEAARDTDLFSSAHSAARPKGVPPAPYPDPLIPIDVDGPAVQEYRRVAMPWMSPGAARQWEPRIREITTELIDEFIESGAADLSQQLFTPVPARLILEILGWDAERWPEWIVWIHALVHDRAEDPDRAAWAAEQLYGNIAVELEQRRGNPTDDLFSEILRARFGGQPFTDEQITGYAMLLLLGGMDTTAGLAGNAIVELARDDQLRQRLIDNPSLLPNATEEFLRHDSPAYGLTRTVTRDAVFHGEQLRAGERVVLLFPAAGLDPAAFADPDALVVDRYSNRHVAFGLGPHRCLGSNHARTMFQVMLGEVLRRLPDFRVSGELVRFHDAGDVYAVKELPVSFTPGPRSTT